MKENASVELIDLRKRRMGEEDATPILDSDSVLGWERYASAQLLLPQFCSTCGK
jgi:hypothetical protein